MRFFSRAGNATVQISSHCQREWSGNTCNGICCAAILIRLILALFRAVVVSHRLTCEILTFCGKGNRRIKANKKGNNVGYDRGSLKKNKGSFHHLLPELAAHDTVAFKSYMWMDFEHFSKIVDYLSERLHKKDTVMRECVKSAKMCCLAIRSLFSQSVQQHWLRTLLVIWKRKKHATRVPVLEEIFNVHAVNEHVLL